MSEPVDVCVVCNRDAESESWSSYIVKRASSRRTDVRSSTLLDTDLSRPASQDTLRTAKVVVVVLSRGHLDFLARLAEAGSGASAYGACSPHRALILLCGVKDGELERTTLSGRKVSFHFPDYSRWQRVAHDVGQDVLSDKLNELMSSAQTAGVQLLQTTAYCEVGINSLHVSLDS